MLWTTLVHPIRTFDKLESLYRNAIFSQGMLVQTLAKWIKLASTYGLLVISKLYQIFPIPHFICSHTITDRSFYTKSFVLIYDLVSFLFSYFSTANKPATCCSVSP